MGYLVEPAVPEKGTAAGWNRAHVAQRPVEKSLVFAREASVVYHGRGPMKRDLSLAITAAGAAVATFSRMKLRGGGGKLSWALIALNAARAVRHGLKAFQSRKSSVTRVKVGDG